jgi:hypothetical protein
MNIHSQRFSVGSRFLIVAALAAILVGGVCTQAFAEEARPGWALMAHTFPTYLTPGKQGVIEARVLNVGAASNSGPVTVTDVLPPGVTATEAGAVYGLEKIEIGVVRPYIEPGVWDCSGNEGGPVAGASVVTCVNDPEKLPSLSAGGATPTEQLERANDPVLAIGVTAPTKEGTISEPNRVTVAGGGSLGGASTSDPVTVSATPAGFGFADADAWFSNANGTIDTQAGSHPYEATFAFDLNNKVEHPILGAEIAGAEERDLTVKLPPGFVGDPTVVARCSLALFKEYSCPANTQIGVIAVEIGSALLASGGLNGATPVFNLVPPEGEPAQFGFDIGGIATFIDTKVRSGSDYGLISQINNIAQREILSSVVTLWGEPEDRSHAAWHIGAVNGATGAPFLTLPTSCENIAEHPASDEFAWSVNEWEDPSAIIHTSILAHNANHEPEGFTGCEHLVLAPAISIAPDTSNADTPAGLTVEVKPALDGLLAPGGLSTADLKDTKVALPEGVAINPGQAAGLQACGPTEDGLTTDAEKAEGKEDAGPPSCPGGSKVGTDEIQTPLLAKPLAGNVYVLRSEPPEIKLLVAASGEGVDLKLVGTVHLNEQTGQLVTTFENTPELPFTDFRLSFSGGPQAALSTPTLCGTYGAAQGFSADFTSWASPFIGDALPNGAAFGITAGTNGGPCPPSPLPFSPSMIAGATTDQAAGYTSFSFLLQRPDDQQRIGTLQFKTPEGLLGMISRVPLCPEPQASQGTCSAASQIGHSVVAAGPGPYPLVVPQPGQPPAPIYLTGGYKGAPYGLSIVVPLAVGPFVLPTQVVRAKIDVDPHTARLTVTTDPLPTVISGVPADLRTINAVIDRPEFMFNPTNCAPQAFTGIATSTEGATAPLESHFQMGSCRSLEFKPNFKVSTSGKTSRSSGASLEAKIVYPSTPAGFNQASSQSNIKSVKVDLPKQLPSQLKTLQHACPIAVFNQNPANCPANAVVGHATAITPVLPVPLTGPAYFVSHAGEEFPQLIVVLQGYGVSIDLVGDTFINSKTNVTSSTFKEIPDVPITSFDLLLPQGNNAALAAPAGKLCQSKLVMPTAFTAQDGAVIKQNTPISVTGCGKSKKPKSKKTTTAGKHKAKKK